MSNHEVIDKKPGSGMNGWIRVVPTEMTPPSLKDNTADTERLIRAIEKALQTEKVTIDLALVSKLPAILRDEAYHVRTILYNEDDTWHVVDLLPFDIREHIYGLAIDLGSATIVCRLLDLITHEIREETSFFNPQIEIGPDILTRIHYASQKGGLSTLKTLLSDRLNEEITHIAERQGIEKRAIVGAAVAGNPTMTHLLLGLDPHWICREPYIPVINKPGLIKSTEMGLKIHPEAPILVFPNVGSYFGGDLIAGILATGMTGQEEVSLLVDVGTNAEVVLGNREWLMACAGAAGPALEGGVAGMGMMAGPGVIDKVVIEPGPGDYSIRTIHDKPPIGICGSGLIDLVAQLFLAGTIDLRGKFIEKKCGERIKNIDGIKHLVVVFSEDSATGKDLTLSQPDIDALMRSKAAMYTILTTITKMVNVSIKDIRHFYIAGTFGSYIDPKNAITLGMIPDLPIETYKSVGNTSLEGATMALLSAAAKREIDKIRDRITYVELNVNQEFMNLFSAARFIPHTDRSLFPSVKEWKSRPNITA
ncbi:ASKHA domain-containing protein [bacterium]|nr:ASKHA domain-containing protein [bacterium]